MRRILVLAGAVVFVETIFYTALAPLLPFYEHEFGLSKTAAGLLTASYAAGAFAAAVPAGLVASRLGVRPTTLIGLALLSSGSLWFGFASSALALDAARFVQGTGSAIAWTGALTWLVAVAPAQRRGEMLGFALGVAVVGALLGPMLGAAATIVGTKAAFSGVSGVGVALAGWVWTTPGLPPSEKRPVGALLGAIRRPTVAVGIWLLALGGLLLGVISVLAPFRLDRLGWSASGIAGIFLVSAGVGAVLNPLLGRWSDGRGRLAPIRVGLGVSIGVSVALVFSDGRWPLAVLVVLAGVAYGLPWVPGTALLLDGAEEAGIGHAFGFTLFNLAWAPGYLAGSSAGGWLGQTAGDQVAYLVLAGICFLTLVATQPREARMLPTPPEEQVTSTSVDDA